MGEIRDAAAAIRTAGEVRGDGATLPATQEIRMRRAANVSVN